MATIELWNGPVRPEPFTPDSIPEHRQAVNVAANALHVGQRLAPKGETIRYKVAWIGGADVLYDREKLLDVGGFGFWDRLPAEHAGEDAVVQFLLIHAYGGCGVLPSGTYHLCLETTVPNREVNATALFGDLLAEWKVRKARERDSRARRPTGPGHPRARHRHPRYPGTDVIAGR